MPKTTPLPCAQWDTGMPEGDTVSEFIDAALPRSNASAQSWYRKWSGPPTEHKKISAESSKSRGKSRLYRRFILIQCTLREAQGRHEASWLRFRFTGLSDGEHTMKRCFLSLRCQSASKLHAK